MRLSLIFFFIIHSFYLSSRADCVEISGDEGSGTNTSCIINEYKSKDYSTGKKITQTSNTRIDQKTNIFSCINSTSAICERASESLIKKSNDFSDSDNFKNGITENSFNSRFRFYE